MEVSAGFLLLAAWLNYWDRQGVFPRVLLACTLHELGHLLALRWMVFGSSVLLLLSALAIGQRRITRFEGAIYLAIYVAYVILLMK